MFDKKLCIHIVSPMRNVEGGM